MSALLVAQINQILNQLGIDNPTVADRTSVMNFLKEINDGINIAVAQLGIDNPTVADRTSVMNFLKVLYDQEASNYSNMAWYGESTLLQLGVDNPTVADRTTIMNYLKLLESSSKARYSDVFEATGTWTCPAGVTKVFITACAGGGAGHGYDGANQYTGGTGGVTSFGALLTLSGGTGGGQTAVGKGGGHISGDGGNQLYITSSSGKGRPGDGGSSIFINGPVGANEVRPTNNARGPGGQGFQPPAPAGEGGKGGGAGAGVIKYPLTVVPGTVYTITIGAGGTPTPVSYPGQPGGAGYMIIEYNM